MKHFSMTPLVAFCSVLTWQLKDKPVKDLKGGLVTFDGQSVLYQAHIWLNKQADIPNFFGIILKILRETSLAQITYNTMNC